MRHEMLYLGRVLGGGVDQHGAVLPGERNGDLPFQVEVVLAACPQTAL